MPKLSTGEVHDVQAPGVRDSERGLADGVEAEDVFLFLHVHVGILEDVVFTEVLGLRLKIEAHVRNDLVLQSGKVRNRTEVEAAQALEAAAQDGLSIVAANLVTTPLEVLVGGHAVHEPETVVHLAVFQDTLDVRDGVTANTFGDFGVLVDAELTDTTNVSADLLKQANVVGILSLLEIQHEVVGNNLAEVHRIVAQEVNVLGEDRRAVLS